MLKEFASQYAELSNEELLRVASHRDSLTDEAASALDAEMCQRKLTHDDITEHQRFVKQSTRREARKTRRKLLGTRRSRESWTDGIVIAFITLLVFVFIAYAYIALPQRYHFPSDWEKAAENVLFASVFLVVAGGSWRRNVGFWMSLLVSSAMHAVLLHVWITRGGDLDRRPNGKLAVLLGMVLFFVVYGCGFLLCRKLYGEKAIQD